MKVVALVGCPNVGKSTFFNRLTKTRDALVADFPGLTRDRKYGRALYDGREYIVIDTGGIAEDAEQPSDLTSRMTSQALLAIDECDLVIFMVDARAGIMPGDYSVADYIRRSGKPCAIVANKVDGMDPDIAGTDFYALGLGEVYQTAVVHGRGVNTILDEVIAPILRQEGPLDSDIAAAKLEAEAQAEADLNIDIDVSGKLYEPRSADASSADAADAADRRALHRRSGRRVGRHPPREGLGRTVGRGVRPGAPHHHSENPPAESRHGPAGRRRARRQRARNADPLPQPPGRTLCPGRQFRSVARRGAVPARGAPAGHRRALVRPVARHHRRRMARLRPRAGRRHGRQPPHQGHHGDPHPRHDVQFGRRVRRRDPAIPLRRSRAQSLRHLDHGIARRCHREPAHADAAGRRDRARAGRRRHQAAEPPAAGRELRPHDGAQRTAHAHTGLPLDGPAGRDRHGLLRPGGLHRACRPASGPHDLRLGRPPHPDAGLDACGCRPAADLRPAGQDAGPADQHHHGADGHPGRDLRRHPQPQPLLNR